MDTEKISTALNNAMQDGNTDTPAQEPFVKDRANPEQWKSCGYCEMCRRQSYCGADCKARMTLKKMQAERDALKIMMEAFRKAEGEDGDVDAGKAEEAEEHNDQE